MNNKNNNKVEKGFIRVADLETGHVYQVLESVWGQMAIDEAMKIKNLGVARVFGR